MAGKYTYIKGASTDLILKDTLIVSMVDLGGYVSVRVDGFDYGSFAVFDRWKILSKPRVRRIVYRKKPCHCPNFGFGKTEWMAGVPIYCKIVNDGVACPLIKQTGNLFECNYRKAPVKDYIAMCNLNEIEVERFEVSL